MSKIIHLLDESDRVEKNEITIMLRKIASENSVKVNEIMKLMRSSLTGLKVIIFYMLIKKTFLNN